MRTRPIDDAFYRGALADLAAKIASGSMPQTPGQIINPSEIADDAVEVAKAIIEKVYTLVPVSE